MIRWPLILALAAALSAAGSACAGEEEALTPQSQTTSLAPTPTVPSVDAALTPSPASTPSPPPSTGALKYLDPVHGYSFEYPPGWYLSPPKDSGGQVILYSYDPATVRPEEAGMPVPKDKLKVFFWVQPGVTASIEAWLAETDQQAVFRPTVSRQENVQLAGRNAVLRVTQFGDGQTDSTLSYYLRIDPERLLIINAGPADSQVIGQFGQVARSLGFAQ